MSNKTVDDAPFAGKRILVVEDEFLIALDIETILQTAGASEIVAAARLPEALAQLDKGGAFDAAVLDLKLERQSSIPVAERLLGAGTPFIFLTGAPTEAGEARRFDGTPVVGKPFDTATLVGALAMAMAAKR